MKARTLLVEQIVLVRGAEFIRRLGDLRLFRDRQVLPDLAVAQFHFVCEDAVGVDGVAGMDQEIRAMLSHGLKTHHAAVVRIDAPALSGDIAAPDETHVAAAGRRGAKAAGRRFAGMSGCDRSRNLMR